MVKGIIFNFVEEIVAGDAGRDTWDDVLEEAGVDGAYTSVGSYDDEELFAIVDAAADELGMEERDLLRHVGRESIPRFYDRYPELFEEQDGLEAFLRSLNGIIHPEVEKLYPGAEVPQFDVETADDGALLMGYASPRKLCHFGEGLIQGAADHYDTAVEVEQVRCMHRGDQACQYRIEMDGEPGS